MHHLNYLWMSVRAGHSVIRPFVFLQLDNDQHVRPTQMIRVTCIHDLIHVYTRSPHITFPRTSSSVLYARKKGTTQKRVSQCSYEIDTRFSLLWLPSYMGWWFWSVTTMWSSARVVDFAWVLPMDSFLSEMYQECISAPAPPVGLLL